MPTTEAQILTWLSVNWPSVALGLSAATIYVAAYLRLQTFLARIDKAEREIVKTSRELLHVKLKLAKMVLGHCRKYPEDMETLMKIEEDDAA